MLELARPLAEVARNALTAALLLGMANVVYVRWDGLYSLYQVAVGEAPLKG